MSRIYKVLSERLLDKLSLFSKMLAKDDLTEESHQKVSNEYLSSIQKLDDIENFDPKNLQKSLNNFHNLYERLYKFSLHMSDEESLINRIESQAARRALFYRIMTTFGIGLTIMVVYAIAHENEIPMPLMRMPL
ncbi:MAG: hypothetical protein HWE18_02030 [Gammaproteobacteria bacterium]|nr:hypothetical protein [Gammaproteobacteria bacterium]